MTLVHRCPRLRVGLWLMATVPFWGLAPTLVAQPIADSGPEEALKNLETLPLKPSLPGKREPPLDTDHMIWNFGLNGARNVLRSDSGKSILGSHGAVQFGAGYLSSRWYAFGSLDFITGPFEPVTVAELDVDYIGTGFSVWTGMNPLASGIRTGGVGYGVALGVSYSDLVGRSIGYGGRRSATNLVPQDAPEAESYTLETTNVSAIPAIFISYLEKPRFLGNTPDLLATRLEGHILTFGVAFPVAAEYSRRTALSNGEETVESGPMRGRRFELTWTSLLAP